MDKDIRNIHVYMAPVLIKWTNALVLNNVQTFFSRNLFPLNLIRAVPSRVLRQNEFSLNKQKTNRTTRNFPAAWSNFDRFFRFHCKNQNLSHAPPIDFDANINKSAKYEFCLWFSSEAMLEKCFRKSLKCVNIKVT